MSDWIQLGALLVALAALVYTIRSYKKQLQIQIFADYTKRYQEIILNFPENINQSDFDFNILDEKYNEGTHDKTMRYMRVYFDLCSEEFDLRDKCYITEDIFDIWKGGMKYALTKKAFRDAWQIISKDTKFNKNFEEMVKKLIASNDDHCKQLNKNDNENISLCRMFRQFFNEYKKL